MSLHEDYDDYSPNEYNFDEDVEDIAHKKKVKRMLEDRLERKRLKEECKDDFDEYDAEFDWDDVDK